MEVIKAHPENLDQRSIYKMVKSPDIQKMSNAEGSVLEVVSWVLFNDYDNNTGEQKEVLTVLTADMEMFGTVSPTFLREFKDIVEIFGPDFGNIKVSGGKSRAGRNFITCCIE